MTKLERLKEEKSKIYKLFDDVVKGGHRGEAISRLTGTALRLVNEMISEQERSIESGERKSSKNVNIVLSLAEKNYCKAVKFDSAFRGSKYDPWEITVKTTLEEAKALGIKDKRTVLRVLDDPTYRRYVEIYGPEWDDIEAWKSFFQPFLDNKNYRLPESEEQGLIELRSRLELPWDTLFNLFIENEKKRDTNFQWTEDKSKELKGLRSRLEPYQGQ